MHDVHFPLKRPQQHLLLLLGDLDIVFQLYHGPTADLNILPLESNTIDLLLVTFILNLQLLNLFILLDDLQFKYFDHILVVLYRLGFVLKTHNFNQFT